jgi:hypothetical protein
LTVRPDVVGGPTLKCGGAGTSVPGGSPQLHTACQNRFSAGIPFPKSSLRGGRPALCRRHECGERLFFCCVSPWRDGGGRRAQRHHLAKEGGLSHRPASRA